jgi:hypothetical protein
MPTKRYSVIGLIDPRCRAIYFVGTSVDPLHRFQNLRNSTDENQTAQITRDILDVGLEPELTIIDEVETHDRRYAEMITACHREILRNQGEPISNSKQRGLRWALPCRDPYKYLSLVRFWCKEPYEEFEVASRKSAMSRIQLGY